MPWGTGERKEETPERDPGFTGNGSEGDRGGEAQTGPGLVILRYHVLRITVSVTCARARAQCVTLCMCTYTQRSQYRSLGVSLSLSFSYLFLRPSSPSFALFSLPPTTYHLFSSLSLFLSTRCRGRLAHVFFLPGGTRVSLARISWR